MKEKIYDTIMIVLMSIVALVVVWLLFLTAKPVQVDCNNIEELESGYKPIPKQCTEGE